MFWGDTPLYYSENPAYPATILITIPEFTADIQPNVYRIASMIKAAGVALHYVFPFDEHEVTDYHAGVVQEWVREFFDEQEELPTDGYDYHAGAFADFYREYMFEEVEIPTDVTDYHAQAMLEFVRESFTDDGSPIITDTTDYAAGALGDWFRESFTSESDPIITDATNYDASAEYQLIREWFMELFPLSVSSTSYAGGAAHEKLKEDYTGNE
jgi:hypothetical protein